MRSSMIRITSGTAKNKKLIVPDVPGIRAVQEVVKLAIFSILGEKVDDAMVLDLFAGSGNLGLEALSRGAQWCDFVDDNYNARQAITKNIKSCGFEDKSEVFFSDAVKYVANTDKKYTIIFADPFYDDLSHKFLMKNLEEILNPGGTIIFLHGDKLKIEKLTEGTNLKIIDERKYGKSILNFISS